ncbi:hypothetical protein CS063_16955 [Sporanaerobium hydrogeniformans]|uniref:Uncharacterized protein n=1 Tax=Sporanaerobium hydrogeniformans TaxID=3072179 RepID=A0AC61D8R5_9FIRM|nr:hypothetical protein CS063_16955 [Sporanaerobium hydrogeniformans]
MSIYQDPIRFIKCELYSCWIACKNAHASAMKDTQFSQTAATTYALSALSHLMCIKSVYVCNYDKLENTMVESLIHQFDVFCNELITNFCTNHSHQWTDLEFDRLKELVTSSDLIEI